MISRLIHQRYEVLERIGGGVLFQVYKARDKNAGRVVVVKTLHPAFVTHPALLTALRRSAASVEHLNHPQITRTFDFVEPQDADEPPFLVTEFVRGINLKERIQRIAPFTLSVAVDFSIAITEALTAAHAEGIVHGDLRPHNVIISPEGAVKVTDFALTEVYRASEEASAANLARAAAYQSPEIIGGKTPGTSADLYAMGVMLYEMLTGVVPFAGETPVSTAMKHQNDPIPSPRSLNPGVPRAVEGIVMRALQKRPESRYGTANDLLNDLKAVRDALRFGKSLSWSPMEASDPPQNLPEAESTAAMPEAKSRENAPLEPVGAARMSATRADDRVSPYIKIALATIIIIFLGSVIWGTAIYMANFPSSPPKQFGDPVGRKYEEAAREAEKLNITLKPQYEFNEKVEQGVIYSSDFSPSRVRPGRSIMVFVSKGSKMVAVADVRGLSAAEAEKKLKDAGLNVGNVARGNSDTVAYNRIIRQNPSPGKRVQRETPVNLQISDGPKPVEENADGNKNPPDKPTPPGPQSPTVDTTPQTPDNVDTGEARTFNLAVTIKPDGRGTRRVRVEYDDTRGTHRTLDEYHAEGEVASQQVQVYGSKITVRIYYGDDNTPVSERTYPLKRSN